MKTASLTRRLITVVLLLEFFSSLVLMAVVALYESHTHLKAFDVMLRGRADTIFGAVQDADDANDNVMLDMTGLSIPKIDYFDVVGDNGQVLGKSQQWPNDEVTKGLAKAKANGIFRATVDGKDYRFIIIHGVRVVDPGTKGGGVAHPVHVIYGAPTERVWWQVIETVRFYAIATLLLLAATGAAMVWSLRRGLAPLKELAEEAARISAQQWNFHPPASAYQTQELAPLTRALEAALGRLQEAFSQQRRFTSNAAHELKTDVAIAKSSLQLLNMRSRSIEEYQQGLEACLADCMRLEDTVQRMLTLARAENSTSKVRQHETSSEESDAVACIRRSIDQLSPVAGLSQVFVHLNAPEEATVSLISDDCTILFSNLLHNALTHSKPESAVDATITVADNYVTIAIQDSGDGIAAEDLPHVCEPFYRGDSSRDRRTGSTGLGLSICKAICESAGGSLTLTSELNIGTLATVRLPLAAVPNPAEHNPKFSFA